VCIGPVAPVVPDPVGPVIQGLVNAPLVILPAIDGNNNNDSFDESESVKMTDNVIAPPTFNGKYKRR